jgi:hypothetical protein
VACPVAGSTSKLGDSCPNDDNVASNLAIATMNSLPPNQIIGTSNNGEPAELETQFPFKWPELLNLELSTSVDCRAVIKQERVSFATMMQLDPNFHTNGNLAVTPMVALLPNKTAGAPDDATPAKPETRFPYKLYNMLDFVEHEGLSDVVSWLPDHRAFKIHDRDRFMSHVAPRFFNATKLRSIHRQLSVWGFMRLVELLS